MKHNVILILLDGLSYSVAHHAMGHLLAYRNAGRAALYKLECELPSLSRPLYECILTGVAPIDSGIVHNQVSRLSSQRSVFHYATDAGLTTAAAAYHWVSELYNRSPFMAARDRHTDDVDLPIQHGHFYYVDHYPDSHLFDDAEHLRTAHAPHFLFVHPMNIDDAGHKHGLDTPQYRNSALRRHYPGRVPAALARCGLSSAGDRRPRHEQRPLPQWRAAGRTRNPAVRAR
jgi:predicted AlkP superfamily pyrophosphatase or phosphodiesterase